MVGLIFHPEAKDELREAAAHYEGKRAGLGQEFLAEPIPCLTARADVHSCRRSMPESSGSAVAAGAADRDREVRGGQEGGRALCDPDSANPVKWEGRLGDGSERCTIWSGQRLSTSLSGA